MFRKRNLVLGYFILLLVLLTGSIFAQNMTKEEFENAQVKYKALVEEIRKLTEDMKNATPEEYDKMKADYDKKTEELAALKTKISEYGELSSQLRECGIALREGINLYKLKQYTEAISKFDDCINKSIAINSPLVNGNLTNAYLRKGLALKSLKKYEDAINTLDKVIQLEPDQAQAYYYIGSNYEELGNYDRALEYYNKAVEKDERYKYAYRDIGKLYYNIKKDYPNARKYADKVIGIDNKDADALELGGRALWELAKYDDAERYFVEAIAQDKRKRKFLPYYYLGDIYNRKKQYNKAIDFGNRCLNIRKNFGGAYIVIGDAYKGMKDENKAIEYYEKAKNDRAWRPTAEHKIDMIKNKDKYIDVNEEN